MTGRGSRRLPAAERKEKLLKVAIALLEREGLEGFSLEAAAREAGVALSLPRHYFGSSRGLLRSAVQELVAEIEAILLDRKSSKPLETRLKSYMDALYRNRWGHQVWMRAAEIDPELDAIVRDARRRMAESMYRKPWKEFTMRERIDARGLIGYVEAVVADAIERGGVGRELIVDLLATAITLPRKSSRPRLAT